MVRLRSGAVGLLIVLFARTAVADDESHFRGGVNVLVGTGLGAGLTGLVVGGAGRAGWAIDRRFAFYEQLEVYSWNGTITTTYNSAEGGLGARFIALGAYSPFEWLELAVGPSIDLAATGTTTSDAIDIRGPRSVPIVFSGGYFGFREHLAVRIPVTRAPPTATGPSLMLDLHSFFIAHERLPSTLTVGLGYEWF